MPKALSQFKSGQVVKLECYRPGCENHVVISELGAEQYIHPSFTGAGRIRWALNAPIKSFFLCFPQPTCGKCGTCFASAIIVSQGRGKKPIIFGYDPEPA